MWLIEINSSPDTAYSTSITKQLVQEALPSMMKIILDYPDQMRKFKSFTRYEKEKKNKFIPSKCPTKYDNWILLHKQDKMEDIDGDIDLTVIGHEIKSR